MPDTDRLPATEAAWVPFRLRDWRTGELVDVAPMDDATWDLADPDGMTHWVNGVYVVRIERWQPVPGLRHLAIFRLDGEPARDWRDLQRIKSELVGDECEGVELFPAESNVLDVSNTTHLWVWADPEVRLPFGFQGRLVLNSEEAAMTTRGGHPPQRSW